MRGLFLEVIVCSVADALAAEEGGADRLEVVRALEQSGLTPPIDLVRGIQRAVRLPLRVMVREHDDFRWDRPGELDRLCEAARELDAAGVDGIVVGFARDGAIDPAPLERILRSAPRLRATIHRAFDAAADPLAAVQTLSRYPQVDRILTSGGDGPWRERCLRLAAIAALAHPRISVLPGGGVDADAIERIAHTPLLTEAHVGRAARVTADPVAAVSGDAVRALRQAADVRG